MRRLIQRLRELKARHLGGVRCRWCTGGTYQGYSPTASLSTIRSWGPQHCGRCTNGYMNPQQKARDDEYEDFWRSGRYKDADQVAK